MRKNKQGLHLEPDAFSFGVWDGVMVQMKNKQPIVLFLNKQPVTHPYMVLSRHNEMHFKTYREALTYFKRIGENEYD